MRLSRATSVLFATVWLTVGVEMSAQTVPQPVELEEVSQIPDSEDAPAGPEEEEAIAGSHWWAGVRGERAPDRLYAGLWTLHLQRTEDGLSQHYLLALGWRGMYVGTFMNTHGNRTWALALARSMVMIEGERSDFSLGYRVGLLMGYDEHLWSLAGRWPAIPGAELVGSVRYGRVGLQGQFAGIVSSFGMFVSF